EELVPFPAEGTDTNRLLKVDSEAWHPNKVLVEAMLGKGEKERTRYERKGVCCFGEMRSFRKCEFAAGGQLI
ncbi:hypothetical protein AVEN_102263-1, partial [Araneus ventricosus]